VKKKVGANLDEGRKYIKKVLTTKFNRAGLKFLKLFYINALHAVDRFINGKTFRRKRFPSNQLHIFNLLIPLLKLEELLHLPCGLSLVVVAEK